MEAEQSSNKRNLPPPMMPGLNEAWLVFVHGDRNQKQTFCNIYEGNYYMKSIPLMRRKDICTCSHGWMVLDAKCSDDTLLFNPTTMEKIQLPPAKFIYNKCLLTSSPDDPTCTVLFISCPQDDLFVFRFCNPRQYSSGKVDGWIKKEMKFNDTASLTDATSINGKVYVFMTSASKFREILIIDATTTLVVSKMEIEIPSPYLPLVHHERIVESCGEIYCVRPLFEEWYTPFEILDVEIFKLDLSKKCWERVNSIGNRAFFLGRFLSSSASAKDTYESECGMIYITMEKDRSLYAYNVEDKSITISLPCHNLQNHWSQPSWFLP